LSDTTSLTQYVRQEMPAAMSRLYLNAGTFGPIPNCVEQAVQQTMQQEWQHGRLGQAAFQNYAAIAQSARQGVARLLHAEEHEIALTANTGEGLNIISHGLNWHEGDEIITTNHEHISALGPLYQIRDRYGATLKMADLGPQAQRPALEAIEDLVTERTRLIVLSHVTWTTGAVLDIRSIARMGRERHIPVLIDGAQSAGAIPIDIKALEADFYAIPMQKWLCGPGGTGALYVSQEAMHYVTPTYVGYMSVVHEGDEAWQLHQHAQRFEIGGRLTAALAGQAAVLNWLEHSVGYEWLLARISQLHSYACQVLQAIPGLTLLTPQPGASGLIAFTLAGIDDGEAVQQLQERYNIYVRNIPPTHALRVSTGFYNTEEEIDMLVQALRELQSSVR
jgi:L-cysteine/cystine lyase